MGSEWGCDSNPDLCAAVGATRRTLHLGFVELYGCRPCNTFAPFARGAREDLTNTRGRDLQVTDVAMKWGFEHLGRFAPDCGTRQRRKLSRCSSPTRKRREGSR